MPKLYKFVPKFSDNLLNIRGIQGLRIVLYLEDGIGGSYSFVEDLSIRKDKIY